jgi:hypothetical protein
MHFRKMRRDSSIMSWSDEQIGHCFDHRFLPFPSPFDALLLAAYDGLRLGSRAREAASPDRSPSRSRQLNFSLDLISDTLTICLCHGVQCAGALIHISISNRPALRFELSCNSGLAKRRYPSHAVTPRMQSRDELLNADELRVSFTTRVQTPHWTLSRSRSARIPVLELIRGIEEE